MSAGTMVVNQIKDRMGDFMASIRITMKFLKKQNPALKFYQDFESSVKEFLTINTKLKIARYRVRHMRYRLNQMEQIMKTNSSTNYFSGSTMDLFR